MRNLLEIYLEVRNYKVLILNIFLLEVSENHFRSSGVVNTGGALAAASL
jgi:hypothetical protein